MVQQMKPLMGRWSSSLQRCLVLFAILVVSTVSTVPANAQEPSSSSEATGSNAPSKRNSPATDLKNYPKLTNLRPSTSPVSQSAKAHSDVVAEKDNGNGTVTTTYYTPAAGVTPAALAEKLRGQGVAARVVTESTPVASRSSATAAAAVLKCYRTAKTFRGCSNTSVHWSNAGYADPRVLFADQTGNNWPVDASTYTWNQSTGIDSYYGGSGACSAGFHCVPLKNAYYGNTGWAGLTNVSWNVNTYNIISADVKFNDSAYHNSSGYRQNACHEMGHALGMGHSDALNSCLYFNIENNSAFLRPSSDDFYLLGSLYSITYY